MAKALDAIFDPSQQWVPMQEGTYPAHIASLSTKEVNGLIAFPNPGSDTKSLEKKLPSSSALNLK